MSDRPTGLSDLMRRVFYGIVQFPVFVVAWLFDKLGRPRT